MYSQEYIQNRVNSKDFTQKPRYICVARLKMYCMNYLNKRKSLLE